MPTAIVRRVLLVVPNVVLLTTLLFRSVFSLPGTAVEMMPGGSRPRATRSCRVARGA